VSRAVLGIAVALVCASSAACERKPVSVFSEPMVLGGMQISAHTLNRGKRLYDQFCSGCHGPTGAADTPTARQLQPRPASFKAGRFLRTVSRMTTGDNPTALPSDDALAEVIESGLPGTAMPAWRTLGNSDIRAIIHYLKTLSPRWRTPSKTQHAVLQHSKPSGTFRAPFRAAFDLRVGAEPVLSTSQATRQVN
jgi:mono/diheme cytochrome c family protein